jgi:hypothetical protein
MIDATWEGLETYLSGLTEQQMTDLYDDQGWNIRDHITHLAAWEKTNWMLLQGKPRYEGLIDDPALLYQKPIDEENAILREHWQHLSIQAARAEFGRIHHEFRTALQALKDADLSLPAGQLFPQIAPDEPRKVMDILQDNANGHIAEHLPWIQAIAGR